MSHHGRAMHRAIRRHKQRIQDAYWDGTDSFESYTDTADLSAEWSAPGWEAVGPIRVVSLDDVLFGPPQEPA